MLGFLNWENGASLLLGSVSGWVAWWISVFE